MLSSAQAEGWGEGRNRELVAWKSGGEAKHVSGMLPCTLELLKVT